MTPTDYPHQCRLCSSRPPLRPDGPDAVGFPAWTGGALQYINHVGPAKFVARADQLAKKCGERFAVPKVVREKAKRGALFV